MTPVASVEEEGLAGERRRRDEAAAPKVDVIGLKTITSYLKSYLTTTSSGALNETAIDLKIEQAMGPGIFLPRGPEFLSVGLSLTAFGKQVNCNDGGRHSKHGVQHTRKLVAPQLPRD